MSICLSSISEYIRMDVARFAKNSTKYTVDDFQPSVEFWKVEAVEKWRTEDLMSDYVISLGPHVGPVDENDTGSGVYFPIPQDTVKFAKFLLSVYQFQQMKIWAGAVSKGIAPVSEMWITCHHETTAGNGNVKYTQSCYTDERYDREIIHLLPDGSIEYDGFDVPRRIPDCSFWEESSNQSANLAESYSYTLRRYDVWGE